MLRPSDEAFDAVAATFRRELLARPEPAPSEEAGRLTVETNSGFVERRGRPLVDIACERSGSASLRGMRLADLGCGVGALSAYFAFRGARVVGVDARAGRLEVGRRVAARHGLDVDVRQGRMESLDLPDASFEVAVMNNSLVYLVERSARLRALGEALRVLVPGGVLVIRNANRLHPIDQFAGIPLIQLLPPATAVRAAGLLGRRRSLCRLLSPSATRRELVAAGFAAPVHHATAIRPLRQVEQIARYTHFSAVRP